MIFHYCIIIIDLRLPIIFFLSSGDIYLSLDISLSFSFVIVSDIFCCEFLKFFVIFYIPLSYYFNRSSSITFCLSGDTYISLGISLSWSFVTLWIDLLCFFWNFCDFLIFHYYAIVVAVYQQFLVFFLETHISL